MRANIKLIHGDCMSAMENMSDNTFDVALVDPPYGLDKSSMQGSGKLKHRILNISNTEWDIKPTKKYFSELFKISKNQIIWGGNYFELPTNRCFIIWDKQQFMPTFSACEYAWTSFNKPSKIFKQRGELNKIHPTQKPVQLYKWLLQNYAKEDDKILDTHGGSMSLAIACWDLGFDCTIYEINKEYYDNACLRLERHQAQGQLF